MQENVESTHMMVRMFAFICRIAMSNGCHEAVILKLQRLDQVKPTINVMPFIFGVCIRWEQTSFSQIVQLGSFDMNLRQCCLLLQLGLVAKQ